jgi:aryl-alcohol dehydrogenase-like predicted oxidoreductase
MSDSNGSPTHENISNEELKKALKAFRKRLKLTRLDYESRLGYGPMSKGGDSGITAIPPPNQFPAAVWEELVRQGKLKYVGQGLYELADGV